MGLRRKALSSVLALLSLLAVLPLESPAQSREQLDKWGVILTSVRNGECRDEEKKKVVGKIDYAIMLIGHSEVEEAESSLASALSSASSLPCRQAIEANGKLSSVK